jgi:hypothetical protein
MDVVSRRWLSTLVSAEETSTQVEACFTAALAEAGLDDLLDAGLFEQLRAGDTDIDDLDADAVPVLLAMSDNGPQMRSHSTREFLAGVAIAPSSAAPACLRPGLDRVAVRARQGRTDHPAQRLPAHRMTLPGAAACTTPVAHPSVHPSASEQRKRRGRLATAPATPREEAARRHRLRHPRRLAPRTR